MAGKEANHNPGLCPVEGQQFSLGLQIRPVDEFTGLSMGSTKALPTSPMLVNYPAIELVLYRSPRDPQDRLMSLYLSTETDLLDSNTIAFVLEIMWFEVIT